MFVEIPPKISVSDYMRRVKACTLGKIQQEFRELRQRFSLAFYLEISIGCFVQKMLIKDKSISNNKKEIIDTIEEISLACAIPAL